MKTGRMVCAVLGLCATAVLVAGCGTLSSGDYHDLASAICTRSNEEAAPLLAVIKAKKGEEDFTTANELLKIKTKQHDQLAALNPPAEDGAAASEMNKTFGALLQWRIDGFSKSSATQDSRPEEPPVKPSEVNEKFRGLGLDACVDPSNVWLGPPKIVPKAANTP